MLSGKTFLITGSTGRLGSDIVPRLEEFGATVLPVVLDGYPHEPKRVKWKAKSNPIIVNDTDDLDELQIPDYVINFHWRVDRTLPFAKQFLYELDYNIHHTASLWEWLANKPVQRFINISSTKVFSHLNQNPILAETEPRPVSPYGIAKLAAEKFLDAHFRDSGFPMIHLRLSTVASFGEHPSHLVSKLCASAFENRRITINTGHTSYIIYIDEVVDLIINAAFAADKRRYIVATSGLTTDQIALKFEQITGHKINADYIDLEPGIIDPIFVSDIQSLRTDWTRCTSLESTIKKIADLHHHSSNQSCVSKISARTIS